MTSRQTWAASSPFLGRLPWAVSSAVRYLMTSASAERAADAEQSPAAGTHPAGLILFAVLDLLIKQLLRLTENKR